MTERNPTTPTNPESPEREKVSVYHLATPAMYHRGKREACEKCGEPSPPLPSRTVPEREHDCPCCNWSLAFNAYSKGYSDGVKHGQPTNDEEHIDRVMAYATNLFPHEVCDSGCARAFVYGDGAKWCNDCARKLRSVGVWPHNWSAPQPSPAPEPTPQETPQWGTEGTEVGRG